MKNMYVYYNPNIVGYNENKKKLTKVQIKEDIEVYNNMDFEGDLNDLIDRLTEIRDKAAPNLVFIEDDSSLDEDSFVEIKFKSVREETDAEFEQRMELIAKDALNAHNDKIAKEAKDKALYEELKQKYEKTV